MTEQSPSALNVASIAPEKGTSYPPPFDEPCRERAKISLGDLFGLNDYGVNWVTLPPGDWSAQRHWHSAEDELLYVLSGTPTLVTDEGERILGPGDFAGFPAGRENGHHLVNKSNEPATYLEIGSRRAKDTCHYPDIDLHLPDQAAGRFTRKDGTPY